MRTAIKLMNGQQLAIGDIAMVQGFVAGDMRWRKARLMEIAEGTRIEAERGWFEFVNFDGSALPDRICVGRYNIRPLRVRAKEGKS